MLKNTRQMRELQESMRLNKVILSVNTIIQWLSSLINSDFVSAGSRHASELNGESLTFVLPRLPLHSLKELHISCHLSFSCWHRI